jgi:hypothetical protein
MCRRAGEGPASQRIVGLLEASLGSCRLAASRESGIRYDDRCAHVVYTHEKSALVEARCNAVTWRGE